MARRHAACCKRCRRRAPSDIDGQPARAAGQVSGSERVNRTSPERSTALGFFFLGSAHASRAGLGASPRRTFIRWKHENRKRIDKPRTILKQFQRDSNSWRLVASRGNFYMISAETSGMTINRPWHLTDWAHFPKGVGAAHQPSGFSVTIQNARSSARGTLGIRR